MSARAAHRIERERDGDADRRRDARKRAAARLGRAVIDVLGGLAQGELAQGAEVLLPEEVLERGLRLRRRVDLALPQPVPQLRAREVDVHDRVCFADDAVRDALLHFEAGRGLHDVLDALEMLDVAGGHDGDARGENVLHVLPAFLVLAAGGIRVRELVDDRDLRLPCEDRVEVHLLEDGPLVLHAATRDHLEVADPCPRIRPAVSLDERDDDVHASRSHRVRVVEHLVRLADARRLPDVDLQVPALGIARGELEESLRIGAIPSGARRHAPIMRWRAGLERRWRPETAPASESAWARSADGRAARRSRGSERGR